MSIRVRLSRSARLFDSGKCTVVSFVNNFTILQKLCKGTRKLLPSPIPTKPFHFLPTDEVQRSNCFIENIFSLQDDLPEEVSSFFLTLHKPHHGVATVVVYQFQKIFCAAKRCSFTSSQNICVESLKWSIGFSFPQPN